MSITKTRPFFMALILLLSGTGFCAQPAARKPLPETAVLDRVDGKLLRIDVNDTWLFELTMEAKTPSYQLPAGTRFVLLPSTTLSQLIADVNERSAPRYRLFARVTQYQGKNYLVPTYYLPLSRFKDDQRGPEGRGAGDEGQAPVPTGPVPQATAPVAPELAIPPEVLEQLKKQRSLRSPRKSTEAQKKPARESPDRVLVDYVGRIETARDEGPRPTGHAPVHVFVPYALGWSVGNIRYELLPCLALEQALQQRAQARDPIRFNVAGLVTEFKGKKYLLLQRAIVVYNYGNFGQ